MSLFQCSKCGCIENTAMVGRGYGNEAASCSACEPNSISAMSLRVAKRDDHPTHPYPGAPTWHQHFKRVFLPKGMFKQDWEKHRGDLRHKVTGEPTADYERDQEYP